jgi:hypothetical protein
MLTGEECYAAWAPEDSVWSAWAKPVLFAQEPFMEPGPDDLPALSGLPRLPDVWTDPGLIVDLPGPEAIAVGLALAGHGFRPVPLFNGTSGPMPVVDVTPIRRALAAAAGPLRQAVLPREARPAFLLDAHRMRGAPRPGAYDNRWIVLPQDVPSAVFLLTHQVREITVIQRGDTPAADLSYILKRWRDAGVAVRGIDLTGNRAIDRMDVRGPSFLRLAWYTIVAMLRLHRSNIGGFGAVIPQHTARGGFAG